MRMMLVRKLNMLMMLPLTFELKMTTREDDEMKMMLLSMLMMDILTILKVLLRTLKDLTMLGA